MGQKVILFANFPFHSRNWNDYTLHLPIITYSLVSVTLNSLSSHTHATYSGEASCPTVRFVSFSKIHILDLTVGGYQTTISIAVQQASCKSFLHQIFSVLPPTTDSTRPRHYTMTAFLAKPATLIQQDTSPLESLPRNCVASFKIARTNRPRIFC